MFKYLEIHGEIKKIGSERIMLRKLFVLSICFSSLSAAAVNPIAKIFVNAGAQPHANCPVTVTVPADSLIMNLIKEGIPLRAISESESVPVTALPTRDGYELAFMINQIDAWKTRTYELFEGTVYSANPVQLDIKGDSIDVRIGGKPFTTYDYSVEEKKQPWPILYPVFGPNGVRMTRGYPMEEIEGESKDHKHHQSIWVSHGDINGVSFWELSDRHGYTKQNKFEAKDGPTAGRIVADLDWVDHDGNLIFEEERMITFWGTPETARLIDFDLLFKATKDDVKFGDTKEGGLISLRIAESIREKRPDGSAGGEIINAVGQKGEKEAWGKPAPWCDYSGPVGDIVAGFTIMDHPGNPFYPTRYHVRSYGLFTANPFGLSDFIDRSHDGSKVLKKGESWHIRFRVYLHQGGMKEAKVSETYSCFANAPSITLQ